MANEGVGPIGIGQQIASGGEFQFIPTISDARSAMDILQSGERARRFERIPLDLVITETPVIDPEHASELAADIAREQQMMPILVRATENLGAGLQYQIADGFHRSAGMKAAEMETIEAVVMYGWSYEELLNKRILSANSVKSVKFGRLATWMEELYELTPWHEMGIRMTEAVTATVFNNPEIGKKTLENHQLRGLKEWVNRQARNWQMPLGELWSSLSIIEESDPKLVHLVRPKIEQGEEHKFIVQGHLRAVTDAYPGRNNYNVQRALINWVLEEGATPKDVDRMAEAIKDLLEPGMRASEVVNIIERVRSVGDDNESSEDGNDTGASHRQGASSRRPRGEISNKQTRKQLEKERDDLKSEVDRLTWWRSIEGSDDTQGKVLELVLGEARKIDEVGNELGIDKDEVGRHIIEGLEKRDTS